MEADEALRQLGGVAASADLHRLSARRRVRAALAAGSIVRPGLGTYALADVGRHRETAARLSATLSHLSAAQHWGWAVKDTPDLPWVTVPRNRKVTLDVQARTRVTYADLDADDVEHGVTGKVRTVVDCARRLPFDEALSVADSALRAGDVTRHDLQQQAARLRGRGATQARRVAEAADGRAANPFESVLRALVLDVGGFEVVPQAAVVTRGRTYHPDLVDARRRVVIEADSYGFHGDAQAHARDCVRYNALTAAGWAVLRFTWEHVMTSTAYVVQVLRDVLATTLDTAR